MYEKYYPVVVQALVGHDYTVYAYFSDGLIKKLDMKPVIANGGVFEPLKDKAFFANRLTVLNNTVAWDMSGDFDPTKCIDMILSQYTKGRMFQIRWLICAECLK